MEDKPIHLSLAKILKQSARQSCYFWHNKTEKPVTEGMIKGNEMAHEISISKYMEMRGQYHHENLIINYSFDEIVVNDKSALFIEHKNITSGRPVEMWYFESSILQTAVWHAFVQENPNKHLQTATFYLKEGNPLLELELENRYLSSELHMSDKVYHVQVKDPKKLVAFYCEKALATFDWDLAKAFDAKYKFKEYAYLQDCLTFRH